MLLLWYHYSGWSQLTGSISTLRESKTRFNKLELSYLKHIQVTHSPHESPVSSATKLLSEWERYLKIYQSHRTLTSSRNLAHTTPFFFNIQSNKRPRKTLTENSPFMLKKIIFQKEDLEKPDWKFHYTVNHFKSITSLGLKREIIISRGRPKRHFTKFSNYFWLKKHKTHEG